MANAFDFELKADEQVSAAIQRIEDAVKSLDPLLEKTTDNLKLGGQDSIDGLDSLAERMSKISTFARDNVQFIGDMVPPLKMVGELSGKLGGALKFGAVGAAAAGLGMGVGYLAGKLQEASHNAYELDVAAKNAGMRVDDFSRLSGAMQILGINAESANQSTEGLFYTFNEALQGRNSGTLAALEQIGVQIVKNKNGTADVLATMERLARVLPTLTSEKQKTVTDAIGLDANGLALLREGVRLKELLSKSDTFGLTVDPKLNSQLTALNGTINELGASYDGLMQRIKSNVFGALLSDGSVKDGLEGITDVLSNGLDSISLGHAIGLNRGNEAEQLRWGYNNPEFYKTLSEGDKIALDYGYMTDGYREKYNAWQKPINTVNQLEEDLSKIYQPVNSSSVSYGQQNKNSRGLRNNNPGNLRAAPNTIGNDGDFSIFPSARDGNAAMARQLMLYGDRGNNTLSGIIHTYAPANENNTQAYINDVAKQTGIDPRARIDLSSPETLNKLMAAMIKHENGSQPFSKDEIDGAIYDAVFDPRWSGKRDQNLLLSQRTNWASPLSSLDDKSTSSNSAQDEDKPSILYPTSIQQKDINKVSEAMSKAISENKFQLEVTLINSQTGERHKVQPDGGGRVSVSMQSIS